MKDRNAHRAGTRILICLSVVCSAVLALCSFGTPGSASAAPPWKKKAVATPSTTGAPWQVGLQTDTIQLQRALAGELALYVKDVSTGARYNFNAATPTYLASGVKLAVMAALFRQAMDGNVNLETELVYNATYVRDGAPLLSYLRFGTPVSVRILLEAMIQRSDNAATDMLIDHIGLGAVNREIELIGIREFGQITTLLDVRRRVYEQLDPRLSRLTPMEIFQLGMARPLENRLLRVAEHLSEPSNKFTPSDYLRAFERYYDSGVNTAPLESMALFLERLVAGQIVSQAHSQQMLEIMLGTRTGARRARAGLPPGTPFAHKTGTQFRRICDFGVFYLPDARPIVFAACVKGGTKARAEYAIARIAERSFWHLASPADRKKLKLRVAGAPLRERLPLESSGALDGSDRSDASAASQTFEASEASEASADPYSEDALLSGELFDTPAAKKSKGKKNTLTNGAQTRDANRDANRDSNSKRDLNAGQKQGASGEENPRPPLKDVPFLP